jgi:hypothetical protein
MADHFYGVNRGIVRTVSPTVTEGSSTGSTDVEVRVADAAGWTKYELRKALDAIIDQIALHSTFPLK